MNGQVVIHKVFGRGTITEIQQKGRAVILTISFPCGEKKIQYSKEYKHFVQFEDTSKQNELDNIIQKAEEDEQCRIFKEAERKRLEEEARLREEAERQNAVQIERNHRNDEASFERLSDDRMFFIVFQNRTFDIESRGNYLWAPTEDARGVWPHHWQRLTQVRKGDVIFHCAGGAIQAVSIAEDRCFPQLQPHDPVYGANWARTGMQVNTQYTTITTPTVTAAFRPDIMRIYPAGSLYAPFDRNGDGNQGYLFELDEELANIFLNDIKSHNPLFSI